MNKIILLLIVSFFLLGCVLEEKVEIEINTLENTQVVGGVDIQVIDELNPSNNLKIKTDSKGIANILVKESNYKIVAIKEGYFSNIFYKEINSNNSKIIIKMLKSKDRTKLIEEARVGNYSSTEWSVYDGEGEVKSVLDEEINERVFKFEGNKDAAFVLGDNFNDELNPKNIPWEKKQEKLASWKMKFNEDYKIYLSVTTTLGGRYLTYSTEKETGREYVPIILENSNNGEWQSISRNLEEDLKTKEPENNIISIDGFLVRGNGLIYDLKFFN
ncbi:hypothetical protein IIC68_00920 [archaeon]|nr:hypothetical protein [archaeon]